MEQEKIKEQDIEYLQDAVNFYSKHAIENLNQKNITSRTREKYEDIRKMGSIVYPKLSKLCAAPTPPSVAPTEEKRLNQEAENYAESFRLDPEVGGWKAEIIKHYKAGFLANREGWVKVEDGLPEQDTTVLVRTAYMSSGKEVNDYFMAYMDEYGDVIICPNDESYGWEFNDVVTHWMPLPQPPIETSK